MPTTTPFANLITFSRGSNATVVGSNGLVQWAPNNLLTNSEQFDASAWTKAGATTYANQDFGNGTLGPELVTNGDFSGGTTTGWSATGSAILSVVSGRLRVENGAAVTGGATQTINTVAGRTYFWTYYVDPATSGGAVIRVRDGGTLAVISTATRTVGGTYVVYFVATGATTQINCINSNSTIGAYQDVDDISVKELTPAAAIAPDGTQTADTLQDDGTSSRHGVNQNPTIAASATYTTSLYVKAGTGRYFTLSVSRAAAGSTYYTARYDLQTATVTATGASGGATYTASSITAVGNGWYRCVLTGILSTATDAVVVASGAINPTGFGDRGAEIYVGSGLTWLIWGAQLELGTAATTYNPTTVKNLLGFSEAFDNAAWTKTRASIVTGAAANPINGLFNAQKLMEDTSNNTHFVVQNSTAIVANTRYVQSVYAKAGERSWLYMTEGNNVTAQAWFNLASGVVGAVTGTGSPAATITAIGNGWYRCSLAFTPIAATANVQIRVVTDNGVSTYQGDGNSGIYIYGAQLSDSASLDPYVPTPGAAPSSTAYYGPRFDYDPATLQPRGILIEEQRTNLLTYSEQFDNAAWSKLGGAITANAASAPDGTVAADQLVEDTSTGLHVVFRTVAFTSGTTYTLSFWVKRGTGTRNASARLDDGVSTRRSIINLATGAVTPASGHTVTTRAWGAYWYVTCTVTAVGTASAVVGVEMADGLNPTYTGDGASSIDVWGAQLEVGAFATSYIPTIASTVTRNADVALITGQNFGQWYSQSEGAWAVEWAAANGNFVVAQISGSTSDNRFLLLSSSSDQISVTTATVSQGVIDAGTINAGAVNKLSYAYRTNDTAASLNGGAAATDNTVTLPTVDRLCLGATVSPGSFLNGHIRNIRFIPARAADFQLQALTT